MYILGASVILLVSSYVQAINPSCNCATSNDINNGEYPMLAGIVCAREQTIKCGAVIIDKEYVLTAAHCVANKTRNEVAVVVGDHDDSITDSPDPTVFRVKKIISHEQYNPITYDNDIAIIQLLGSITYCNNIKPVCLPFKFVNKDFTGASVIILGWNTTISDGRTQKTLLKAKVISQSSCNKSVSTLTKRQMCTLTQGTQTCQDVSSGPVLYLDSSKGRLFNVGVVSYGDSCASGSPEIDTRVTAFLKWIVSNAPANYCRL